MNHNKKYLPSKTANALRLHRLSKLNDLKDCSNKFNSKNKLFITEWEYTLHDIYGVGCDSELNVFKLQMNVLPGFYAVCCPDIQLVTEILKFYKCSITVTKCRLYSNSFTLFDFFFDPNILQKRILVKVCAKNFADALYVHRILRDDPNLYRFINVSQYWDLTKLIFMERFLMVNDFNEIDNIASCNSSEVLYVWFDSNLNLYNLPKPKLLQIYYDIETISSDSVRLPTGDHINDILFSVSILHVDTNLHSTLYSLVYLPLNEDPSMLKNSFLENNSYPKYENVENFLEIFTNERDLLKRVLGLLYVNDKMHASCGFNDSNYDIKFLITRCKFYNLSIVDNFIWDKEFRFGYAQIHLDFFRFSKLRFNLQSYSLNFVAENILKRVKIDVDSVSLRYLFYLIKEKQKLFDSTEFAQYPSLCNAIHYNNCDTLLVYDLVSYTSAFDVIIDSLNKDAISFSDYVGRYNEIQYRVLSSCFIVALKENSFFSSFKKDITTIGLPFTHEENEQLVLDAYEIQIDVSKDLMKNSSMIETETQLFSASKKKLYPGGFNYCFGEHIKKNVQIYDLKIAYLFLINSCNISDETACIIPANILLYFLQFINVDNFIVYDYLTHTLSENKSEEYISNYQYINENLYCGGKFDLNAQNLTSKGGALVILIIKSKVYRGVLPRIVARFNEIRDYNNKMSKLYETISNELIEKKSNLLKIDKDHDFENDFSFDSDSDSDMKTKINNEKSLTVCVEKKSNAPNLFKNDFITVDHAGRVNYPNVETKENLDEFLLSLNNALYEIAKKGLFFEHEYRKLKIFNSSLYGCIGKIKPSIAAKITCLIRTFLISICQKLTTMGHEILYCDTDSVFVLNSKKNDLSSMINQNFPHVDIKLKSVQEIMFVKRKIYYTTDLGKLYYSQNKLGPSLWHDAIQFFFRDQNKLSSLQDIDSAFETFFVWIYAQQKNLTKFHQILFIKKDYKTSTPQKKLQEYLEIHHPSIAKQSKQIVYYFFLRTNPKQLIYRPSVELTNDTFYTVNLFAFFIKVLQTIYNIIKIHLRNNLHYDIYVSKSSIEGIMFQNFLKVHEQIFPFNQ